MDQRGGRLAAAAAALLLASTLGPGRAQAAPVVPRPATSRIARAAADARLLASVPAELRGQVRNVLLKPDAPAACEVIPGAAEHGQAWIAGYANVTKLRGAALVGPAFADLIALVTEKVCPKSVVEYSTEVPSYHGRPEFPPMRATFLAFGFVPVTATIQISQVGIGKIYLTLTGAVSATPPYIVTAVANLKIRVLSVKVNGISLPAGTDCGTASTGKAILTNVNPTGVPGPNYWDIYTGGPLSGTIRIPHFAGCGANGDNLDPILDASISGPANLTKLIQGMPCIFGNLFGTTCPPQVPKPRR